MKTMFLMVALAGCMIFMSCNKTASENPQGDSKPVEKRPLSVMMYDRGNMPVTYGTPDNNQWTRYVKEHWAGPNNVELTYVNVPRWQDTDRVNVMMASKTAPDVIFTYSEPLFYNYALQGGLIDLTDLLSLHAPDIVKIWGEDVLKYGRNKGRQYAIYAKRSLVDFYCSYIRKDWLDKIGVTLDEIDGHYVIGTDELFDVLVKFKNEDPGNVGKENVFPMGAWGSGRRGSGGHPFRDLHQFAWSTKDLLTEEIIATQPNYIWPGVKDGFRYLNKLYNAGLFDPDFALQKDDKTMWARIINNQTGFWSHTSYNGFSGSSGSNQIQMIFDAHPEAEIVAVNLVNSKTGQVSYKEMYPPTGMIIMIPSYSQSSDLALQYLNWLAKPENDFALRYGNEGEHYNLVDGFPLAIDREHNAKTQMNLTDLLLPYNGDPSIENELYRVRTVTSPERVWPIRIESHKIGVYNAYVPMDNFGQPVESEGKFGSNLIAKGDEIYVQSIMAKPDDFDTTFDRLIAEYMQIGGKEVMDEKIRLYKELQQY